MKNGTAVRHGLTHLFIITLGLLMIYPILWMIVSSLKPNNMIFSDPGLIPKAVTIQNYITGWKGYAGVTFGRFFLNSLLMCGAAVIGNLISCTMAAYAFARLKFAGRNFWFTVMLITLMLPGHVTVDNLVDERFSRNEIIVQVLSDMGFIERLGYGIDRMIWQMAEAGLPPPAFRETTAGFQVTLFGYGAELISEEADARRWRHLHLNERQQQALTYLVDTGRITNREYQELCPDVSPETIRRDLADLVRKNLLRGITFGVIRG